MKNALLYQPTRLNSTFHGGGATFQDYCAHMQNIIMAGRADLKINHPHTILAANNPFELRPNKPSRKGILLVHGLYDSPFTWHEIAKHLVDQGFWVRTVLLPGHGTVPGDLLNIHYQAWIDSVSYGITSFAGQVDELYLGGFSLGGALAIYQAMQHPVKALLLFAPALKESKLSVAIVSRYQLISWFKHTACWYQRIPQVSYAKYESFPCNAALQASLLMHQVRKKYKKQSLNIPIFIAASADDELVSPRATIKFFSKNQQPKSRFLFYSNDHDKFNDSRITVKNSAHPEQRILNYSHISIPTSPANPHFGVNGDYHNFTHLLAKNSNDKNVLFHLGAITKKNLQQYNFKRLSFNPDFDNMLKMMDEFLVNV